MIDRRYLENISRITGLNLYQQEKDYMLKLVLYYYYKNYDKAVFKGGTCIKYLFGTDRFSEDLDFNIITTPKKFREQIKKTIERISLLGFRFNILREEEFSDAFTCEVAFDGPLSRGTLQTRNKFRIDAGKRTGTFSNPQWKNIKSEYPETGDNFLVLSMKEEEMLAEKIISMMSRKKGRDLYDVWFLLNSGIKIDKNILKKKTQKEKVKINIDAIPEKAQYENDMKRISNRIIPYDQVRNDVRIRLKSI